MTVDCSFTNFRHTCSMEEALLVQVRYILQDSSPYATRARLYKKGGVMKTNNCASVHSEGQLRPGQRSHKGEL